MVLWVRTKEIMLGLGKLSDDMLLKVDALILLSPFMLSGVNWLVVKVCRIFFSVSKDNQE